MNSRWKTLCSLHTHTACAWAVFAGLLLLFSAAPALAEQEQGQSEKLRSLSSESLAERKQALNWLAEHGGFSSAATILERLKDDDREVRSLAEQTVWAVWSRSGSKRVDEKLKMGGYLMSMGKLWQAVELFDEVISERPGFAEGYNKRATAWYLLGSYYKSLADIELTLERNPQHFGALSGAGYCLIRLKRHEEAVVFLRRALKINPNLAGVRQLSERLLKELRRNSI